MEKQLFDWHDGWDQADTMGFLFYGVVTKIDIGEIPAGTKFDSAQVCYDTGVLEFYDATQGTPAHTFNLSLVPVPE